MQRKVFTDVDKLILKELVLSKKHILESKRADGVSLKQKGEIWENIREEFNRETGDNRTTAQLRKLWDNMKTLSKKALVSERKERTMTGSGPGPIPQANSAKTIFVDSPEVVIKDIKGICDSDSINLLQENTDSTEQETSVLSSLHGNNESKTHEPDFNASEICELTWEKNNDDDNNNITYREQRFKDAASTSTQIQEKSHIGTKRQKICDADVAKIKLMAVKEEAVRKECEANLQYLSAKLKMEEREHNKRMELMELERREREQRMLLISLEIEEKKALLKKQ